MKFDYRLHRRKSCHTSNMYKLRSGNGSVRADVRRRACIICNRSYYNPDRDKAVNPCVRLWLFFFPRKHINPLVKNLHIFLILFFDDNQALYHTEDN